MSDNRWLTQQKAIQLAMEIGSYLKEKNEPFADYESAAEWLNNALGWRPRHAHIKTALKNIGKKTGLFVKSSGSPIGGMVASIARRLEMLEARIAKIEQDLN